MRLMNRNQYCIVYSLRCNYACSYCCNSASQHAPESWVERHTSEMVDLFAPLPPGVIMVSGGEPLLWKDFSVILERLPQHFWALNTNASLMPDWLVHPNVKLAVVAYHPPFAKADLFIKRVLAFKAADTHPVIKIIVMPGQEGANLHLWRAWNALGIPTHLTPLEYKVRFDATFLRQVISEYRTSCLYNSRFFRPLRHVAQQEKCTAGTRDMFQVEVGGALTRCSTLHGGCGRVTAPAFLRVPHPCTAGSCFCEWHHWGGTAKAEDNEVWNAYIETGVWKGPTEDELSRFISEMGYHLSARENLA